MLSVAKLSPGQERYYERSVAHGLDDYYAGRGESPGTWAGRGAHALGLDGTVADGDLGRLMDGINPASGRRLRRHGRTRTITVDWTDPITGETRAAAKELAPVAGFDLVFSVPKSVSLLHALGDATMRDAVQQAHDRAWRAAIDYLEDEACIVRTGRAGRSREHADGFVLAAYQHRTSRALDPHLHTHVIVANMAQGADGKWRALDGEAILATHRLAAGYLYQAQLRAELTRTLGVTWRAPVKGMAEIDGIEQRALAEFSQRRRAIEDALDIVERDDWHAAQTAARNTRERKEAVDLPALRSHWRARAAAVGLTEDTLQAVTGRAQWATADERSVAATDLALLSRRGLTEKRTTFTHADVVMAWAESAVLGEDATTIRERARRLVTRDGVERLTASSSGRVARYSTHELLAREKAALDLVDAALAARAPAARRSDVLRALHAQPHRLSDEQRRMVEALATSTAGVVCAVGVAGAGKTTATRALVQALDGAGVRVLGAAPSGAAAQKLGEETGMPSSTLHRLLQDASLEGGLPARCAVIVDEAGMAETRVLEPLLREARRANAKVILIGDPAQLPSVGAGGLFTEIIERTGAVHLTENRRQRDAGEREALAAIREGRGREYVAWAAQNTRIVTADDAVGARQRLLADWWAQARDNPADNVMIALRRRDVRDLNALGRHLMDTAGLLGDQRVTYRGREFAVGDRVVCRRNDDVIGVRNGTRGTIEAIDLQGSLAVATDDGTRVRLAPYYLERGLVQHGYALTGHASQGATVDRSFVLGGDGELQEWGYVAASRARLRTSIYVTPESGLGASLERSARRGTALGTGGRPVR